jgi:hypothetical protein
MLERTLATTIDDDLRWNSVSVGQRCPVCAAPGGRGVGPFRGGIAVDCRRPTALVACGAVVTVEKHSMSKVTRPPGKGDRASQTKDSLVSGTVASWPGPFSPRWAMTTVEDGATRAAAESPEVPDDDSS